MENKIEISLAVPEDARAIREVQYQAWLVTYPNKEAGITVKDIENRFKDAFAEDKIKQREEKLRKQPPNMKTLVAKQNGKIVGFCTVTCEEDRNQLNAIYILPGLQGQGIGKTLWENASKFINLKQDTKVEVVKYNTQAIEFYRKLGFTETGREWEDERFVMQSGAKLPEIEMLRKKDL